MLTNFQILELAPKMSIPLHSVVFKDQLDVNDLEVGKSYVINLSDEKDEDGDANGGSHWTCLHIGKHKGVICPFYFDSYGIAPPENVKKMVMKRFNKKINYATKNVQSIMSDCCGWFALAYLHFINAFYNKTGDIFVDTATFLDLFEDLDISVDWKKNEFILKLFFQEKGKAPKGLDKVFDTTTANDITKSKDGIEVDIENVKLRR